MRAEKEKYIENIKRNIKEIKEYFDHLSDEQINELYKDLKDVFFFYGYKDIGNSYFMRYFISDKLLAEEENLSEFEGVTNAMLFHLKYKFKRKSS